MKIVILAGGPAQNFEKLISRYQLEKETIFIGVDRGAYCLMRAGYPLDMAIGDFDSLTEAEYQAVFSYAKKIEKSPAEKNDTDLELEIFK